MANILSQEEIDALLGVVEPETPAEAAPAAESPPPEAALPYDFRRPNRVSKEQLRFLQTIHEGFARQFGNSLSGYLRNIVDIQIISVDQLTYSEYVLSLPTSTALFLFSMKPMDGNGVLEMNPVLILNMIDRLFGGTGEQASSSRDLTTIETAVVSRLVDHGMKALSMAWQRVVAFEPQLQELMKNPQMMQLLPSTETVIVVTFELRMGSYSGVLSLCYPYIAMDTILPNMSARHALMAQHRRVVQDGPKWISHALGETQIEVVAELGCAELTVSEFLGLRPGDVIKLDRALDEPVQLLVGGERKALARPGLSGHNRAVRLDTPLCGEDEIHA